MKTHHKNKNVISKICFLLIAVLLAVVPSSLKAQPEEYKTDQGVLVGTSDSRMFVTVLESYDKVEMQFSLTGIINARAYMFPFIYDPTALILTDPTYTYDIPDGQTPAQLGYPVVKLSPEFLVKYPFYYPYAGYHRPILSGDALGMKMLTTGVSDVSATPVPVTLPKGDIINVYSIYFRKTTPGAPLATSDFGYYVQTATVPVVPMETPAIIHGAYQIRYAPGQPWENFILNPNLFTYRTPSSVITEYPTNVTNNTATLNATFSRGDFQPTNEIVVTEYKNLFVNPTHRLNWDNVNKYGFIYSITDATIVVNNFSKMLNIDGNDYEFPSSAEIAEGSFIRNGKIFHIKLFSNNLPNHQVSFSHTVTGLADYSTHYAWSFIHYAFETSNDYLNVGNKITVSTFLDTEFLACEEMTNKSVQENYPCGYYTHSGSGWDVVAKPGFSLVDSSYKIVISGVTYTGKTLHGFQFPVGTTTVKWFGFDIHGCKDSCEFEVVVNGNPTPQVFANNLIYCAGEEVSEYTFTGNNATTFTWQRLYGYDLGLTANSGINTIPAFIAVNEGFEPINAVYSVTPSVESGCVGETVNFMITVNPTPATEPVENFVYCNGATAPRFDFTGNNPNALFEWEFVSKAGSSMIPGLPTSGHNYIPTFEAHNPGNEPIVGIYRVRATYTFDNLTCYEQEWNEFSITVLPSPSVFATPVQQTVCSGNATQQVAFSSNLDNVIYKWKRVSGITPELPVEGTGNFDSYSIVNNTTTPLEVIYEVTPVFNSYNLNCQGNAMQFSITVLPVPGITSNIHLDPICSSSPLNYTITTSFQVNEISWVRLPHPDVNNNEGTSGNSAHINEILTNSSSSDVTVIYLISLTAGNCVYENFAELSVVVMPEIIFTVTPVTTACFNETSVNIDFNINVMGAQYTLVFDKDAVGEGFISVHNFIPLPESQILVNIPQGVTPGNYAAALTVKYGQCEKTYSVVIAIKNGFTVTDMSETEIVLCENAPLYLFVKTEGNAQYQWYLDGNVIENANQWFYETVFDAVHSGVYTVEISNDCATVSYSFNVHKNPLTIERKYNDVMYVDNYGEKYVSYQWYKNGQPIAVDGQWQYYTEKGGFTCYAEYNVKAYKADGTYDEACPIVPNDCTNQSVTEVKLYPNPASSGSNITILLTLPDGEKPNATAYMYDMSGKTVAAYQLTDYQTNVTVDCAAGTYLIKIHTESGKEFIEKLIIHHK